MSTKLYAFENKKKSSYSSPYLSGVPDSDTPKVIVALGDVMVGEQCCHGNRKSCYVSIDW